MCLARTRMIRRCRWRRLARACDVIVSPATASANAAPYSTSRLGTVGGPPWKSAAASLAFPKNASRTAAPALVHGRSLGLLACRARSMARPVILRDSCNRPEYAETEACALNISLPAPGLSLAAGGRAFHRGLVSFQKRSVVRQEEQVGKIPSLRATAFRSTRLQLPEDGLQNVGPGSIKRARAQNPGRFR